MILIITIVWDIYGIHGCFNLYEWATCINLFLNYGFTFYHILSMGFQRDVCGISMGYQWVSSHLASRLYPG